MSTGVLLENPAVALAWWVWCAQETKRKGCLGIIISYLRCAVWPKRALRALLAFILYRGVRTRQVLSARWCSNTVHRAGCAGPMGCIRVALPVRQVVRPVACTRRVVDRVILVVRLITWRELEFSRYLEG